MAQRAASLPKSCVPAEVAAASSANILSRPQLGALKTSTRERVAGIAEGVTPVARAEDEAAGRDRARRWFAFEFEGELAAQQT